MDKQQFQQELVALCDGAHVLAMQILGKREDALDVVQDAITSTLTRPEAYQAEKGPLKPWFLRVVRNRCIDLLRQIHPSDVSVEELQDNAANPEQTLALAQFDDILKHALEELTVDQRQIVVLRDYLNLSYAEIADVLDITSGTVMSRLHRSRLALKKILTGNYYGN